jgi:tRNA/tmRNA/rRNA uracil-C5-methylase (TrmA/RlmC/RlmD family)
MLIFKENNYEMMEMALVDMFPHTPHVEAVTLFVKKRSD